MAVMTPTGLYPSFAEMAENRGLIEGVMFDLGNAEEDYIAGKVASPVVFPTAPRENEMNIDYRGQHGRIARMGMWGAYGTARTSKVAIGQRAIPVEGQPFDPLTYDSTKYFNSYAIPAETVAELDGLGIDALLMVLSIPRTQVLVNREAEWASVFGTAANWQSTAAAATAWDQSGADPLGDIQKLRENVGKYGRPDTIIMSARVAFTLARLLGYNMTGATPMTLTPDVVTDDQLVAMLKAKFAVDKVWIASAVTETSAVPNTSVTDYIWSDNVWIGRIGEELRANESGNVPAMRRSAVASIVSQPLYADIIGPRINGENNDTYVARVRMAESLNVVYPQLGGVLTGVLTP